MVVDSMVRVRAVLGKTAPLPGWEGAAMDIWMQTCPRVCSRVAGAPGMPWFPIKKDGVGSGGQRSVDLDSYCSSLWVACETSLTVTQACLARLCPAQLRGTPFIQLNVHGTPRVVQCSGPENTLLRKGCPLQSLQLALGKANENPHQDQ